MISIDDIEKIMQVMDKFNFHHFEFQQDDSKIVVDKDGIYEEEINLPSKIETNVYESKVEKNINEEVKEEKAEKKYIKAAFAGTFYSSKEDDDQAFVKLYDEVEYNTVVGLIEVMKLFNEVEAGDHGTIVDILVKNGEFVQYGQPLFEIKVNN